MDKKRRIIVYIAVSADGFIARSDGGVDWLDRPQPKDHYGMGEFNDSVDAIIWGRNTFDKGIEMFGGKTEMMANPKSTVKNYLFTHRPSPKLAGWETVTEPIPEFAQRLRAQPGKDIWIMGGGGVIGQFLDEGEVDDLIIHIIPTIIGEGIPLTSPSIRNVQLKLVETKTWPDGVVKLHYHVVKAKEKKKGKSSSKKR